MSAADTGEVLKDEVAVWASSSDKLRDVVKWIAASFGALGALLIGTAPLGGLKSVESQNIAIPVISGVLALGSVGYIVWQATSLLTPDPLELSDLVDARFTSLRQRVDTHPEDYLGSTGTTFDNFMQNRQRQRQEIAALDALMAVEADSGKRQNQRSARDQLLARLQSYNLVTRRLVAWAGFQDLHASFHSARWRMFLAAVVAALGITGFHFAAGGIGDRSYEGATLVVHLTDEGVERLGPLLGPDCPRQFAGRLQSDQASGPWQLRVTEAGCRSGIIQITSAEAAVILRN